MPLYMDIHSLDGAVTFEDVGKAHQADLQTQGAYDVSYCATGWTGSTERSLPRRSAKRRRRGDGPPRGTWSRR